MRLPLATAVIGELAIINRESAGRPCPAEQTILVVVEITTIEGQIAPFIANSGAVEIGHLGTGKLEVVDCNVAAGNEKSPCRSGSGRSIPSRPSRRPLAGLYSC